MDRIKQGKEVFPKSVNLLDEKLKVSCGVSSEMLSQLPELLPGDQACLLGTIEKRGNNVTLTVESILAGLPKTEDELEHFQELHGADIANPTILRERTQVFLETHPESRGKGVIFLGEIRSTTLTPVDLESLKQVYQPEEGFMPYQPCIIGVLKPDETGEQKLTLFRIVRERGSNFYDFKPVERLEKPTE